MIILIGAESCTGKTIMAQKLLEKYKIPYLSIDHLKMGLYRANMDCRFTPTDSHEMIEQHLWPVIKEIILTNIENSQNIIIEGCYLFPNRLKEFDEKSLEYIVPVYMGFSEKYIIKNFVSGISANISVIEKRGQNDLPIEFFVSGNKKFKRLCQENNVPFFEIDEDYDVEIQKIYKWIDSKILEINNK